MVTLLPLLLGPLVLKPYSLGDLKILLPVPPVARDTAGVAQMKKSWFAQTPGGTSITINELNGDDSLPDHAFVAAVAGQLATSAQGVITDQKDLLQNGWLGLEASIRRPKDLSWTRTYALPKLLLNVSVMGTKSSKTLADAVLASIEIDPKQGRGPHKEAGPTWMRTPVGPNFTVEFPGEAESWKRDEEKSRYTAGWSVPFGNRRYGALVTTFPIQVPPTKLEVLPELAKHVNTENVKAFQAKIVRRRAGSALGFPLETLEAASADGTEAITLQSIASPVGTITLIAVVPTCWKDSPEVARFLASVKPNETKTPPDGGR